MKFSIKVDKKGYLLIALSQLACLAVGYFLGYFLGSISR